MMGFVYFISNGQHMKIGKATDVKRRLSELQTGSSRRLTLIHVIQCDNMDATERKYHQQFAGRRLFGEWFKINRKEVSALFESVPAERFSRRGWRLEVHRKTSGLRFVVVRKGRGENRITRYICTLKHRESAGDVVTLRLHGVAEARDDEGVYFVPYAPASDAPQSVPVGKEQR